LGLDIRIPPAYIPEEHQRLQTYKVIGSLRTAQERLQLEGELRDRYGPLPGQVRNLLDYAAIKAAAEPLWIQAIERKTQTLHLNFYPQAPVETDRLLAFLSRRPDAQLTPSGSLQIPLRSASPDFLAEVQ